MNKRIQIYEYIFDLEISKSTELTVVTSTCSVSGKEHKDLTEQEDKKISQLTTEIFMKKWDWLIFDKDYIRLSEFKIEIYLDTPIYDGSVHWAGGRIISEMKEACQHCKDINCDFDCVEALKWANIKDSMDVKSKMEELEGNKIYNYACDALESMILAHAIAGVNVQSAGYLKGIRTSLDAMANLFP